LDFYARAHELQCLIHVGPGANVSRSHSRAIECERRVLHRADAYRLLERRVTLNTTASPSVEPWATIVMRRSGAPDDGRRQPQRIQIPAH